MPGERIFHCKAELRQMPRRDLMRLVFGQREKNCPLGGACPFLLVYRETHFCVSEIVGQGCQAEKTEAAGDQEADEEGECPPDVKRLASKCWLPGFE